MRIKVRLIHGIHQMEGNNNMKALVAPMTRAMPAAEILLFEYGFMGFWKARWANDGVANSLATQSKLQLRDDEVEVWVTHSNGAAVAYLAVEKYGAQPDMIININPALDRWRTASIERVETIYAKGDRAVWLSQWLPFHIWGDQGKVGYRGKRKNTINHGAGFFNHPMRFEGHMGLFEGQKRREAWCYFMAERIEEFTSTKDEE